MGGFIPLPEEILLRLIKWNTTGKTTTPITVENNLLEE